MAAWLRFLQVQESNAEKLIAKGAPLEEILQVEDILQDVKAQSTKLMEYLTTPETVVKMLNLLVKDPASGPTEKERFSYPYLVTEILSEDDTRIQDALNQPECLEVLFSFIENPNPVQSVYAHHVCRIFHSLLTKIGSELLEKMEDRNTIPMLVNHLDNFPFCELLFDLIVIVENNSEKEGLIKWMKKYDLIYLLLSEMKKCKSSTVPANTGQILNNIIIRFCDTPEHQQMLFEEVLTEHEMGLLLEIALFGAHTDNVAQNTEKKEGAEKEKESEKDKEEKKEEKKEDTSTDASSTSSSEEAPKASPSAESSKTAVEIPICAASAAVSLLVDIVWNTRQNPTDGNGQPINPIQANIPVPEFINKHILSSISSIVKCLSFDWASPGSSAERCMQPPSSSSSASPSSSSSSTSSCSSSTAPSRTHFPIPPLFKGGGRSIGTYRMKVVVLISTILRSGYGPSLDEAFLTPPDATSSTPSSLFAPLVKLFFDFPSNTLLLSELYTLFETVLLNRSLPLQQNLLLDGGLVTAVIKALQTEQQRRKEVAEWKKKKEESEANVGNAESSTTATPSSAEASGSSPSPSPSPAPSPSASRSAPPPVKRMVPAADHLAHTLHIARLLDERRYDVEGLDSALLSAPVPEGVEQPLSWSWDNLFQDIVTPAMQQQDGTERDGEQMGDGANMGGLGFGAGDMDGDGGDEDWPQWNQGGEDGDENVHHSVFDDPSQQGQDEDD